jgi:hypothetical protein
MRKLIFAFRNFVNAPSKITQYFVLHCGAMSRAVFEKSRWLQVAFSRLERTYTRTHTRMLSWVTIMSEIILKDYFGRKGVHMTPLCSDFCIAEYSFQFWMLY